MVPLPRNVHLLSAQSLTAAARPSVLVRLAHSFGLGEDGVLSRNASVQLAGLFTRPVAECVERTLPGAKAVGAVGGEGLEVELGPLQVRTFVCE